MEMRMKMFILFAIAISCVMSFHSDDEVVNLPDFPYQGRMHSGYLNLKNPKKKLHYWLIESQTDAVNDPLLLWLNGGPGCSSLGGFSQEHGPALFKPGTAEWTLNPYSWNKKANVLYLESPAGVGFSYVDSDEEEDFRSDDDLSAVENLEALLDFFQRFPQLKKNEFFISGESYAGIYIPYLATNILDYNSHHTDKINLKGVLIGNGVTDWKVDAENAMVDYGYTHALYGTDLRESYEQNCLKRPNRAKCDASTDEIMNLIGQVNVYAIYDHCFTGAEEEKSKFGSNVHSNKFKYTPWIYQNRNKNHNKYFLQSLENVQGGPPCVDDIGFNTYYNRADVKAALHVRDDIYFQVCSDTVANYYFIDREKGSYHLYPGLIKSGIRIFKFSGDTDAVVPFNGTEKWIKNLGLPIKEKWRSWNIGDKYNIGGFVTKYEGLTFVTVRGAGHMVPQFKPKESFYLLEKFLTGEEL